MVISSELFIEIINYLSLLLSWLFTICIDSKLCIVLDLFESMNLVF
jgi:hypothetical protein